jgi:hypothetical protein
MFSYLNFIIYDSFQLELQLWFGYRIYPRQRWTLGEMVHFSYYNPAGVFVEHDKLLSKLIKFKYENIKFKKKECEAEHA